MQEICADIFGPDIVALQREQPDRRGSAERHRRGDVPRKRLRGGRQDWKNAFFAGFASAAMFGLRNPNPLKMVSTCALTGAFCAAVGQIRDMNKKVR